MRSRTALTAAATGAASVALGAAALALAPQAGAAPRTTTPMCATAQLSGALGGADAGAGQVYRDVVLTNHGTAACHLAGFPGLSLLDAHGKQIGTPAAHDDRAYQPVVLAPGGSATTTIHTDNRMTNDPRECRPVSAAVRVYPPGNRASLVVPAKLTICDTFTVTPLVAGGSTLPNPPGTPLPTPTATGGSGPSAAPSATPSSQVSAVPSGAPDTGRAPTSGGGTAGALAVGAGAVLVVGGAGVAFARGRRSRARG